MQLDIDQDRFIEILKDLLLDAEGECVFPLVQELAADHWESVVGTGVLHSRAAIGLNNALHEAHQSRSGDMVHDVIGQTPREIVESVLSEAGDRDSNGYTVMHYLMSAPGFFTEGDLSSLAWEWFTGESDPYDIKLGSFVVDEDNDFLGHMLWDTGNTGKVSAFDLLVRAQPHFCVEDFGSGHSWGETQWYDWVLAGKGGRDTPDIAGITTLERVAASWPHEYVAAAVASEGFRPEDHDLAKIVRMFATNVRGYGRLRPSLDGLPAPSDLAQDIDPDIDSYRSIEPGDPHPWHAYTPDRGFGKVLEHLYRAGVPVTGPASMVGDALFELVEDAFNDVIVWRTSLVENACEALGWLASQDHPGMSGIGSPERLEELESLIGGLASIGRTCNFERINEWLPRLQEYHLRQQASNSATIDDPDPGASSMPML